MKRLRRKTARFKAAEDDDEARGEVRDDDARNGSVSGLPKRQQSARVLGHSPAPFLSGKGTSRPAEDARLQKTSVDLARRAARKLEVPFHPDLHIAAAADAAAADAAAARIGIPVPPLLVVQHRRPVSNPQVQVVVAVPFNDVSRTRKKEVQLVHNGSFRTALLGGEVADDDLPTFLGVKVIKDMVSHCAANFAGERDRFRSSIVLACVANHSGLFTKVKFCGSEDGFRFSFHSIIDPKHMNKPIPKLWKKRFDHEATNSSIREFARLIGLDLMDAILTPRTVGDVTYEALAVESRVFYVSPSSRGFLVIDNATVKFASDKTGNHFWKAHIGFRTFNEFGIRLSPTLSAAAEEAIKKTS